MTTPVTSVLSLAAGECRQLDCPAGSHLVCLEGSLELALPPQSLAGTLFVPRRTLAAGCDSQIEASAWLGLFAGPRGARVLCLTPATTSHWAHAVHWVRRLMAALAYPKDPAGGRI